MILSLFMDVSPRRVDRSRRDHTDKLLRTVIISAQLFETFFDRGNTRAGQDDKKQQGLSFSIQILQTARSPE